MKIADLKKPFPVEQVSFRVGSTNAQYVNGKKDPSTATQGIGLAYLDARDVMDRLDEVCGTENWQDRYEFHGSRTVCYLSIRIGDQWVVKADGAGDSDIEAEKGAISDALKRAAVKWGVGRYLYSMPNTWVDLAKGGKKFTPAAEGKLRAALTALSNGEKPVIVEKPNYDKQNDLINQVNKIKEKHIAVSWLDEHQKEIDALPEEQKDLVMGQYESVLAHIEAGKEVLAPHKFKDTSASEEWRLEFEKKLWECATPIQVNNWVSENTAYLKGLVGTKDGVSNKDRARNAIKEKRDSFDLTPAG